jgi:branched-chain amino acid transport system permease protein
MDGISKWKSIGMAKNTGLARFSLHFYYGAIGGLILVTLLAIPLLGNNYINYVVIQMLFLAYLGQAWNIMCGYTGQLSFGHAAFFGVGAYTSSILYIKLGLSPWVGMLLGACLAFIVGIGIGSVSFRYGLRGVFFAFVTLTSTEILRLLTLYWGSLTNGAEGILLPWKGHNPLMFMFEAQRKYLYYYTILVMLLGCTLIARFLKKGRLGYYLAAIRENEDAAEMLGVNGPKYKLIAIGISAFLTALGGTFYAQYYQHFEPNEVFGPLRSFEIIFPVILGGGGNIMGPPIGAFVLQFFEEVTRAVMPSHLHGFHRMLYGALIVFMIIYLPTGLVGLAQNWRDRMVSKYGIRTER